jgi:cell division protein FtsB
MNWPTLVLVVLIALLQYPLWLGKGGWLRVWDYDNQLQAQREVNQKLEQRNAGLDAEVRDLKSGFEAIEERARYELGMIKEGEIFVQVPQKIMLAPSSAPSVADKPATSR